MVAKPFYDEPVIGPMLLENHPPSMLVQPSFDSRMVAQELAKRALSFIDRKANQEVGLFIFDKGACPDKFLLFSNRSSCTLAFVRAIIHM